MARLRAILVRVVIAGLIGAVVTVGVAVGCAMMAPSPSTRPPNWYHWTERATGREFFFNLRERMWGSRRVAMTEWSAAMRFPARYAEFGEGQPVPRTALPRSTQFSGRSLRIVGWPCECAWGAIDGLPQTSPFVNQATGYNPDPQRAVGAIAIGRALDQGDPRGIGGYLPASPIWPGLILNTLFYAAIAWGLLFAPGAVRRLLRRRGGRCVKCGYDLKGLASASACPECGSR